MRVCAQVAVLADAPAVARLACAACSGASKACGQGPLRCRSWCWTGWTTALRRKTFRRLRQLPAAASSW